MNPAISLFLEEPWIFKFASGDYGTTMPGCLFSSSAWFRSFVELNIEARERDRS